MRAMIAGSGLASRLDVVEAEGNVVGSEYTEDLGVIFTFQFS